MNLLCKIGLHKRAEDAIVIVRFQKRTHKWQRRYAVCERCGKQLKSLKHYKTN
jgi:hypothetical protein